MWSLYLWMLEILNFAFLFSLRNTDVQLSCPSFWNSNYTKHNFHVHLCMVCLWESTKHFLKSIQIKVNSRIIVYTGKLLHWWTIGHLLLTLLFLGLYWNIEKNKRGNKILKTYHNILYHILQYDWKILSVWWHKNL